MVTILEQTILQRDIEITRLDEISHAILGAISRKENSVVLKPKDRELITILEEENVELEESQDKETESLEDELENETKEGEDGSSDISYSIIEDEFIAGIAYGAQQVDYLQLWYGAGKNPASVEFEEEYWSGDGNDVFAYSEMLSESEAAQQFNSFQFGVVVGGQGEISQIDRRKMDTWIMFNPSLFKVLETMYSITNEVNYAPLR